LVCYLYSSSLSGAKGYPQAIRASVLPTGEAQPHPAGVSGYVYCPAGRGVGGKARDHGTTVALLGIGRRLRAVTLFCSPVLCPSDMRLGHRRRVPCVVDVYLDLLYWVCVFTVRPIIGVLVELVARTVVAPTIDFAGMRMTQATGGCGCLACLSSK